MDRRKRSKATRLEQLVCHTDGIFALLREQEGTMLAVSQKLAQAGDEVRKLVTANRKLLDERKQLRAEVYRLNLLLGRKKSLPVNQHEHCA